MMNDKEILRVAERVVDELKKHTTNMLEANSILTAARAAFAGGVGRLSDSTSLGETH